MLATIASAEARTFRTTPDAVSEMDRWIENTGARWGIDERTVFRARVCVSELAGNVLEHGHAITPADDIAIELRHKPAGLEIRISDAGAAFDPVAAPPVELDADRIGGRGLRLVHGYAHKFFYRREQGRNIVTIELLQSAR